MQVINGNNAVIIAKHFTIQELVPEHVYDERGERAWQLLDERLILTLDALRGRFGPMIVNNWHMVKKPSWAPHERQWAGLRTEESPWGTQYSQHRHGRAADILFKNFTAESVREYILANPDEFPLIGSLELGTSWFHCDTRNCDRIMTYTP